MCKENKRTIAIVQARMGSKRLPGKVLKRLSNKKLILESVIDRLKAVNFWEPLLDDIVVATSTDKEDDKIFNWCEAHDISCFRGSNENVLSRYYDCALTFGAGWILRVTADCPYIEPLMIYGLLNHPIRREYQALGYKGKRIPGGWDAELFSFYKLEKEFFRDASPCEKEHVTKGMRGIFENHFDFGTDFNLGDVKLDLDTEEDWERIYEYGKLL